MGRMDLSRIVINSKHSMKKYLQRISLLLVGGFVASFICFSPENTSAFNTRVYSKEAACKLADGFHSKSLEVNYPGFLPETNEFYKK